MRCLSAAELLDLWDRGHGQHPNTRAMLLLRACCPELSGAALAELPVGWRDSMLVKLRELVFGPAMTGFATCPRCGERLEFDFDSRELIGSEEAAAPSEIVVEYKERQWRFRLPGTADLDAIRQARSVPEARQMLMQRCLAGDQGNAEIPPALESLVSLRMAEADPRADIQMALNCPGCGHFWAAPFDIVPFFWQEIQAHAKRWLREVHILASRYGWSERDILNTPARRRQLYIEMADA